MRAHSKSSGAEVVSRARKGKGDDRDHGQADKRDHRRMTVLGRPDQPEHQRQREQSEHTNSGEDSFGTLLKFGEGTIDMRFQDCPSPR